MSRNTLAFPALAIVATATLFAGCAGDMTNRLANDRQVLRDLSIADPPIPAAVVRQSKAILVLDTVNIAAGIGFEGGGGTLVRNLGDGRWSAPLAMSVIAGSLGVQIGGEGRQVVLVLNDEQVIERILSQDAYPLMGAAAVAGPNAAQANYQNLPVPSVYSYSKTGGLFVGAMVGGLGITIDEKLNNKVYSGRSPREILSGSVPARAGGIAYAAQLDSMGQFKPTLATEISGDAPE
ncbi:MAG: lipid-binding SYLF domain-containing protein [Phycisphaerales bacterium]